MLGVVDLPAEKRHRAPYFFASQSMWKASKVVPADPPRMPTTSEPIVAGQRFHRGGAMIENLQE